MATTEEMNAEKVREEAFHQTEVKELTTLVKSLQYDCAELTKENDELRERVKKLASRPPTWPKGYRPQNRRNRHN
jgi:predicted RNase H-like nuclease (RuvC/YqgF family)